MPGKKYIGVDIGASNGRIVIGNLSGDSFSIDEVHRFPNAPISILDHLYWDVLGFIKEIKTGIKKAAGKEGEISGIGIDSWALDFGLLDSNGNLLGNPFCYRDSHSNSVLPLIQSQISEKELYKHTGMGMLTITTLAQLLTIREKYQSLFSQAKTLLLLPNLLAYWLTGEKKTEITIAGNSQMLNVLHRNWDDELLNIFNIKQDLLTALTPTASKYGHLLHSIQQELGVGNIPVFATACHDTASALAAAPITSKISAVISCGTWSVIGSERESPILSTSALENGFHNIQAAGEKIYFAIYSIGLWSIQELRNEYVALGEKIGYSDMIELAEKAAPFRSIINPDDATFFTPGNAERKIAEFCTRTDQPIPENRGEYIRVMLEGLALRYRKSIELLEETTGEKIEKVHIIGGGSKNNLLCQFTADAVQKPVYAGPSEATVIANILLQAMAEREINSLEELRELVRKSTKINIFSPGDSGPWDEAAQTFNEFKSIDI